MQEELILGEHLPLDPNGVQLLCVMGEWKLLVLQVYLNVTLSLDFPSAFRGVLIHFLHRNIPSWANPSEISKGNQNRASFFSENRNITGSPCADRWRTMEDASL